MALLVALLMLFSPPAPAAEPGAQTRADAKQELIRQMRQGGYLDDKTAAEISAKYISGADQTSVLAPQAEQKHPNFTAQQWLSWANFFKVIAILLLLVAFGGLLKKLAMRVWRWVAAVPASVYQGIFFGSCAAGLARPDLIWASQKLYIALFCAFALIGILAWVHHSCPQLRNFMLKLTRSKSLWSIIFSFCGTVYFGLLAWFYQSGIFGFFAAVCLSGIFSFYIAYRPGILFLDFKERMLHAVVFGHLVVLLVYACLFRAQPEITRYYDAGIQYYCTIAMSTGLLAGSSPFYQRGGEKGLRRALSYALLFATLFFASSAGYFFLELKAIGSIVACFFVLMALEWLGYLGFRGGLLIGCAVLGVALYGLSLLMENYWHLLVLH